MKTTFMLIIFLTATVPAFAQPATDKVEKRLAELLVPGNAATAAKMATGQKAWKPGASLEALETPIKPYQGLPARLPLPPIKPAMPGSIPEGIPLASYRDMSAAPAPLELPTQSLVRLPSPEFRTALMLPILAQATKDRASLAEPAFEASLDAAMKRISPVRDKPVPFTPMNLPDPFEHIRYGELRNPPSEDPMPPVIVLTKPKP